ncbi:mg2+ transporter [Colletotrichum truncatum]|uniref:Mg2+ transporter n=1 Tax=Colletotrichum truncatum TaxID=5467 RepID=A0ACC3YW16_COLTU
MKELLEVSRSIMSAFVPHDGCSDHDFIVRFWGSLDKICRQINWASAHHEQRRTSTYSIRNFDHLGDSRADPDSDWRPALSWSDCPECNEHRVYTSSTTALGHLHLVHFFCTYNKTNERPFNDPCYVWLLQKTSGDVRRQYVSNAAREFVNDLWDFDRTIQGLHALVARPSNLTKAASIPRPLLPNNLKLAFSAILAIYIVHARRLSLENEACLFNPITKQQWLEGDRTRRNVKLAEERQAITRNRVEELLQLARQGILGLEHTESAQINLNDWANPRSKSVGLEFLALAVMSGLQNRPVLPDPVTNVEEIYKMYMNNIRLQASRRPNRRLFLQMNALQEELNAVRSVVACQRDLLDKYLWLLSPDSFRASNIKRSRPFENERIFATRQLRSLRARDAKLALLKDMAGTFREQFKQTIEVLEEDHGKAIRVFTIVTLFFLPMSFISSFFDQDAAVEVKTVGRIVDPGTGFRETILAMVQNL